MTAGIHHVTAIARDPRRNLDFYTRVLGLRLVKKTVNFDDPGTYHLYYGDEIGRPGTILTFFPWPNAAPGRDGVGQTAETAFLIPAAAIGFWTHRFVEAGVTHEAPARRFGESVLRFRDPDGMSLALVGAADAGGSGWSTADIPPEHAIRGLAGVTLLVETQEPTGMILREVLGLREVAREDGRVRYAAAAQPGAVVDVQAAGGFLAARSGAGSVHHVAFRAAIDSQQRDMAERLRAVAGIEATEQKDRNYFRSVYFREPGGVLFEIATDDPGFTRDESPDALGSALKLPPHYEGRRRQIEAALPALD